MSASKSSNWWLAAGAALIGASHMRWRIGVLAWVAPIPSLVYLRASRGVVPRILIALALFAGYTLAILKICTAPIPPSASLAFALPTTLLAAAAYLAWDLARRQGPAWSASLVFAAARVVTEFVQHQFTPFGSWGAVAYTQIDNLPLLQVTSLVGMAGVSFVVSWVAAALEAAWDNPDAGWRSLAAGFGALRLGLATHGEAALVAAIGTDATVSGFPYPSVDEMEVVNQRLFARTAEAAAAGAKLAAWTEASTLVLSANEPDFLARLSTATRSLQIELVAAHIVPDDATRTYHNKYVWVRPDGAIHHTYLKHHPVPGERAIPGTEARRVVETSAGRAAGAICDDFPALVLQQARQGIDLAVVPSSDWLGIDPIHTQMASVRAIEGDSLCCARHAWD